MFSSGISVLAQFPDGTSCTATKSQSYKLMLLLQDLFYISNREII